MNNNAGNGDTGLAALLKAAGERKIVERCSHPPRRIACVSRICTDLAVIDVTPTGLRVVEMVEGLTHDELQDLSGVPPQPPDL